VQGVCEDCGRPPIKGSLLNPGGAQSAGTAVATSGSSLSSRSGTTGSRRSSSRKTSSSSPRQLGFGLVSLPPLPSLDPLQAVMATPVVPDRKRFCSSCGAKVTHEKGFCPQCGHEYNFRPTLNPGDVVAGQFEIKGAMAYGGLGWIYLGWDRTLSRWVVLKGLLNSKDEASAAAALAERRFLAAVKHPKIVGIYNFVTEGTEGYIVMEYVGGKTLKAIRQERGPLPAEEAIAYILGILPAFSYLERMGMVYCDFKPDNFMHEGDDVKLIDMGGVRRVDDTDGDIYGTKGYSAPEADQEPSFTSDLYTIARTLAVLMMDFKFQGAYEFSLPPPSEQPILAQNESLYRFLLKATHQDPDNRFQTADEMSEQLLGVLREIAAGKDRPEGSFVSHLFFGDRQITDPVDVADLPDRVLTLIPALKMSADDPAVPYIQANLVSSDLQQQRTVFQAATKQFPNSPEAWLRSANLWTELKNPGEAAKALQQAASLDAFDWRITWYQGSLALSQKQWSEARKAFDQTYSELPGEPAVKFALALAYELERNYAAAIKLYTIVARTDPGFVNASFGLARCHLGTSNRELACQAYLSVSPASSLYQPARIAAVRLRVTAPTTPTDLIQAAEPIQNLNLPLQEYDALRLEGYKSAIELLKADSVPPNLRAEKVFALPFEENKLRQEVFKILREFARHCDEIPKRALLLDEAYSWRPEVRF
jgi:serine/threonine-protein kinase PknG